jgi:carboxypeptidase PM20D1
MSDTSSAIDRFRGALRLRTDWPAAADGTGPAAAAARTDAEAALTAFQDYLVSAYPAFHTAAERVVLGPYAVAYRWPGSGAADAAARGRALLLSHYDVVPAERDKWTVEPFGAELKEGFVWSRGTIDTKNSLIAALEAAEEAVRAGFRPAREVWFAFGGDEERSGAQGARRMSGYFAERGIDFDFLLDEGSAVTDGILPGTDRPIALVGIEEKGFLDIELSVEQKPGHSSRPPRVQAAAVLGRALDRLSRKPFPWRLTPSVEAFFRALAAFSPFPRSLALSRARAFGSLFFALAGSTPETASLMRTTVAMTQLEGSPADNVLPSRVRAILNVRILPGWTVESATDWVRRAVADDRVKVEVWSGRTANDPVPAAEGAAEGAAPGWQEVSATIAETYPSAPIIPFLVTATTDSRHYAPVCRAIYRFSPLVVSGGELGRMHGHDERISIKNFETGIAFYRALIAKL